MFAEELALAGSKQVPAFWSLVQGQRWGRRCHGRPLSRDWAMGPNAAVSGTFRGSSSLQETSCGSFPLPPALAQLGPQGPSSQTEPSQGPEERGEGQSGRTGPFSLPLGTFVSFGKHRATSALHWTLIADPDC